MKIDTPERDHPARLYGKYPGRVRDPAPAGAGPGALLVEIPGLLEDDPGSEGLQLPGDEREPADTPVEGRRRMLALARPCLPPGYYAIPSEGGGVWVEFAAGDPRHAIWSGVWLPDGETPRQQHRLEVGRRFFQSPGGIAVEVDESGDESQLTITIPGGPLIRLSRQAIELQAGQAKLILADDAIKAIGAKLTAETPDLMLDLPGRMTEWLDFTRTHNHVVPAGPSGTPTGPALSPAPLLWLPETSIALPEAGVEEGMPGDGDGADRPEGDDD